MRPNGALVYKRRSKTATLSKGVNPFLGTGGGGPQYSGMSCCVAKCQGSYMNVPFLSLKVISGGKQKKCQKISLVCDTIGG